MVKCVDCGLLGLYQFGATGSGPPREVPARSRTPDGLGRLEYNPTKDGRNVYRFNTRPACFAGAADLWQEAKAANAASREGAPFANPIHVERECASWQQWTPGYSPKEHLDNARVLDIEQLRRESQESFARMQIEAEERLTNMQLEVSKALLKVQQDSHQEGRRTSIIALIIAVVSLLVAGAGAAAEIVSVVMAAGRQQ